MSDPRTVPSGASRGLRLRPTLAFVRSLAMVALAALAILILLPAAITAQAAAGV